MHEGDLARRIVEAALEAAADGDATGRPVTRIVVRAAPDAVPSAEALAFHVELAARGSRAEGATLDVLWARPGSGVRLAFVDVADAVEADQASRA